MAFVIHPLTQQSGVPKYTAADFRLTVSNFLTAGTGETFGAVQGVRSDGYSAIIAMSGDTITVHPHSGIIAPWTGVGAYAYAITSDITVPRPTTGDYYVVLTVEDPSQSHGSEPQGRVDLIPTSTPRVSIDGLVIAQTVGTSINGIETRLRNNTVIETVSKAELDLVKPTPRTKGFVRFGDGMGEYEYDGSNWQPMKRVFYGSRLIDVANKGKDIVILSDQEIQTLIGRTWDPEHCFASVMNGDRSINTTKIYGCSCAPGAGLAFHFMEDSTGKFRANYMITTF